MAEINIYTPEEIADILKLSRGTIYTYIKEASCRHLRSASAGEYQRKRLNRLLLQAQTQRHKQGVISQNVC